MYGGMKIWYVNDRTRGRTLNRGLQCRRKEENPRERRTSETMMFQEFGTTEGREGREKTAMATRWTFASSL